MNNFLSALFFSPLFIRQSSKYYYAALVVVALILAAIAFVLFIRFQIRK